MIVVLVAKDTSSFSVTGEHLPDEDLQAVTITHGYSKDHRPDLKQVVLELMVSQDGGIPLLMKCWSGNSDDNTIFQNRSKELVKAWKDLDDPRYLIMDSKGYNKKKRRQPEIVKFYHPNSGNEQAGQDNNSRSFKSG